MAKTAFVKAGQNGTKQIWSGFSNQKAEQNEVEALVWQNIWSGFSNQKASQKNTL